MKCSKQTKWSNVLWSLRKPHWNLEDQKNDEVKANLRSERNRLAAIVQMREKEHAILQSEMVID